MSTALRLMRKLGPPAGVTGRVGASPLRAMSTSSVPANWPRQKRAVYAIERKHYKKEMHNVRKEYLAEVREQKFRFERSQKIRWEQQVVEKEERARLKAERHEAKLVVHAKNMEKLQEQKQKERVVAGENRLEVEEKEAARKRYQLEYLRKERKEKWIIDLDKDLLVEELFDTRVDLKGFWVKPMGRKKPKKTIMNVLDDRGAAGYITDSDDERELLDFEGINQRRATMGHLKDAF